MAKGRQEEWKGKGKEWGLGGGAFRQIKVYAYTPAVG